MRTRTFFALATALLALSVNAFASTGELNGEGSVVNARRDAAAANLPATVIVRVDNRTKAVSVLQSKDALRGDANTVAGLDTSRFVKVDPTKRMAASELNQDSSTDSWFFYFNNYSYGYNYYYPTYNYLGYDYSYQPYYNYSYGPYSYYFYNPGFNYGYGYPYSGYGAGYGYGYNGYGYNGYGHHHHCGRGC